MSGPVALELFQVANASIRLAFSPVADVSRASEGFYPADLRGLWNP